MNPPTYPLVAVDDDEGILLGYEMTLGRSDLPPLKTFHDPVEARDYLVESQGVEVLLVDLLMPRLSGMELLQAIREARPDIECIVVTAVDEAETAIQAVKIGAYDYLVKPVEPAKLHLTVERALERYHLRNNQELLRRDRSFDSLGHPEAFEAFVAADAAMARVFHQIEAAARTNYPVLITGESGTGKELAARAIHAISGRAGGPFVPVNLAAVGNALFEDAFFGHTRGAFTGAREERKGFFEEASPGTLFLDEITEVGPEFQAKLLRAIQEKEVRKQGATHNTSVDVRVIAATNRDIDDAIATGILREDLYYRLSMTSIPIPPLRQRPGDVLPLARYFLSVHAAANEKPVPQLSPAACTLLQRYNYPGNVRELENFMATAILEGAPDSLDVDAFSRLQSRAPTRRSSDMASLAEMEREHIRRVLANVGENRTEAARILGISRSTLKRKLKQYR